MRHAVTNLPASVRQRLLNEAKRRGQSFDYIASLYARERGPHATWTSSAAATLNRRRQS